MRTLLIVGGLLLGVCLSGCSDDLPTAAERTDGPAQAVEAESAQRRSAAEPERQQRSGAAATALESDTQEQRSEVVQQRQAVRADAAVQYEERDADVVDAVEEEESVEVQEPAPNELTEVVAVVVGDAEMRVRPGLAWGVNRRLAAGDEVLVLNRIGGWLRVRVDVCEGWVRSAVLDLGDIDESEILEEAAPPIIAAWQGVEYGVMGQSADAAEVRLLGESEEIVSAPRGEVTLLAEEITVDDLPILIGDETVVFPGDNFRAGQGKILPRADEWMWLPWGWLLAHNEEYIWQWRPETDELEFIRRPVGPAKLSPDGRHLAVLELCQPEAVGCAGATDVVLIALDGSPPISLRQSIQRVTGLPEIEFFLGRSGGSLQWSTGGTAALVYVKPAGLRAWWWPVVVINVDGTVLYLDFETLPMSVDVGECYPRELNDDRGDAWHFRADGMVAAALVCATGDDRKLYDMVFDLRGELVGFERVEDPGFHGSSLGEPAEFGAEELGDDAYRLSNGTDRHSVVIAPESRSLFIHDAGKGLAQLIGGSPYGVPEWFWDELVLGPSLGRWDLYWTDHRVAIVARRHITHVVAGLLVDLATFSALPLQVGSIRTWPCLPTGGWNPDAKVFQIEFKDFSSSERLEQLWIDGTAAPGGEIAQRQIVNSDGETLSVMRALAHLKSGEPVHIAGWSPDGTRLAIGGHQELGHYCH